MSDGEAGSSIFLGLSLLLGSGLLLCFILAGMVSAFVTLVRMRHGGLISDENGSSPAGWLLSRARTLLLTLSIAYLGASALSAAAVVPVLGPLVRAWGGLGWLLLCLVFLGVLLTGSVLLKALALARPLGFVRSTLWLAWPMYIALRPISWLLERLADTVAPSLSALDISPPFSGGEIRGILADEEAAGLMEDDERSLVSSIFDLRDTEIREIMVPRIDMQGMEVETSFDEAESFVVGRPFTRYPVWEESQDKILGILHTKDVLSARSRGDVPTVRQLLRPVHFLPESKGVDEALAEFRERRVHLAVVVDEYGGTAGIVTLEDILEEIVGEIRDEFDQEGERIRLLDAHRAIIDPRIDLDDLNEALGLELPTEDSDTLGGLLYDLLGKVPSRGETVEHGALRFTIDRVERQRILQVTMHSREGFANSPDDEQASAGGGGA